MKTEQRKSAVDLTGLAIGIVILGVVVAIGSTVLINVRNSQITQTALSNVVNETVVPGNNLGSQWVNNVYTVVNKTTGGLINAANYTVTVNSGTGVATISNSTCVATNLCSGPWNVSYSIYNVSDPRYTIANNASVGLSEYGNWFKILVIVGIATVVLSIIFMAFKNKGGEIGGTY